MEAVSIILDITGLFHVFVSRLLVTLALNQLSAKLDKCWLLIKILSNSADYKSPTSQADMGGRP
jgi:hypothetical protein